MLFLSTTKPLSEWGAAQFFFAGASKRYLNARFKEQIAIFWRMEQQARQKLEFASALGQPEIG